MPSKKSCNSKMTKVELEKRLHKTERQLSNAENELQDVKSALRKSKHSNAELRRENNALELIMAKGVEMCRHDEELNEMVCEEEAEEAARRIRKSSMNDQELAMDILSNAIEEGRECVSSNRHKSSSERLFNRMTKSHDMNSNSSCSSMGSGSSSGMGSSCGSVEVCKSDTLRKLRSESRRMMMC